jgi:glycine reductase complex component B subunit gamma
LAQEPLFDSVDGVACGALCAAAQERLGISAVAGMDEENAGAALYRKHVYIINSGDSVVGMIPTLQRMAALSLKLVHGARLGRPEEEGHIPRGVKRNAFAANPPESGRSICSWQKFAARRSRKSNG